ncbi:MAG: GNAT family N-acetyltransferase [Pseudomonadota bacterium]
MSDPSIRRAQHDDAARLGEIFVASRNAALPFLTETHNADDMKAWIAHVLVPGGSTWVACHHRNILGFMTLAGDVVDHLYLDPVETGRGIGSRLIAFAKTQSPQRLTLFCFAENHAARRFYTAHDFKPIAFRDGSSNEEGAPDIEYQWRSKTCNRARPR